MSSIVTCKYCGATQSLEELKPGMAAECFRCGSAISKKTPNSLARTAAFSLAALILYGPANIYPILRMESYGVYSENTVWDGCSRLFEDGQWFVAVIVFSASILVPLMKLLGLFFLVSTTNIRSAWLQRERTSIANAIEVIGPWAMLDVYLLAVLVALVKLKQIATVLPGPGLFAFAAVVLLTILASSSFDPKLIWERSPKANA